MRFGFATTTFDLDGEPVGEDAKPVLDQARLEGIFAGYTGKVRQTIPPFSAKKLHGKPMYSYARKGVEMEPATKDVTIRSLKLLGVSCSEAEFELECGTGTYARSLAHDIGKDYGCGAHLIRLCRTKSGEFPLETAATMREGENYRSCEFFLSRVIPMRDLLGELPTIVVSAADKHRLMHGMDLNLLTSAPDAPEFRLMDEAGDFVALGEKLQAFVSPVAQPAHWVRIHPRVIFA
jgi:tRNA pseudouridine55 synthase